MTDLRWVAADLLTGNVITDLPGIELAQPLAETIGQYESVPVVLHLDSTTSPDWLEATQEGGSVLLAWTGDPASPDVVWGGIIQQRVRAPGSPEVQLALVTAPAYLDACYVGDYTATDLNQDDILTSLMAFAGGGSRMPITLTQLTPSTKTQSVTYSQSSQTTVYAALQALSGVLGGPEWTMRWNWDLAARTITAEMLYGARVGNPVIPGNMPNVTVELDDLMPGSAFTEDYSTGHGANDIITYGAASSTATTGDVPMAEATALDTKGRPLWTYAYQPNQTVSDPTVLADYAEAALTQMQDGAQPLTLTMLNDLPGKQFGRDWNLGDDMGWHLLDGLAFPLPVDGVARCIGYRADTTTITPILQGAKLA